MFVVRLGGCGVVIADALLEVGGGLDVKDWVKDIIVEITLIVIIGMEWNLYCNMIMLW